MTYEVLSTDAYPFKDAALPAPSLIERFGFTKDDLLWALGVWLGMVALAPFVILYALLVN